jgi:hypothetical protein
MECERGDSNPQALRRQILSLVRLPVSPLSPAEKIARSARHHASGRRERERDTQRVHAWLVCGPVDDWPQVDRSPGSRPC